MPADSKSIITYYLEIEKAVRKELNSWGKELSW